MMGTGTKRHYVVILIAVLVLVVLFIYTQPIDEDPGAPVSRSVPVETPAVKMETESEPEPVTKSRIEPEPEKAPIPASMQTSQARKSIKENLEGEIVVGPCDGGSKPSEGVKHQEDKETPHTGYTSSGGKPCIDVESIIEDVKRPGMPPPIIAPHKPPPVMAPAAAGAAKP